MKQTASHSNTPEFGVRKSATSAILYQEPTKEEMSPRSNWFSNFCMTMVLVVIGCSMVFLGLTGCADEQIHQSTTVAKHLDEKMGVK